MRRAAGYQGLAARRSITAASSSSLPVTPTACRPGVIGGRVESRQDGAGRVREEVHPFQAQMGAQGVDVLDQPVNAERHRVRGIGGQPDAA